MVCYAELTRFPRISQKVLCIGCNTSLARSDSEVLPAKKPTVISSFCHFGNFSDTLTMQQPCATEDDADESLVYHARFMFYFGSIMMVTIRMRIA